MINEVREILKEPVYKAAFLKMLFLEIKDFDRNTQINIINELRCKFNGWIYY